MKMETSALPALADNPEYQAALQRLAEARKARREVETKIKVLLRRSEPDLLPLRLPEEIAADREALRKAQEVELPAALEREAQAQRQLDAVVAQFDAAREPLRQKLREREIALLRQVEELYRAWETLAEADQRDFLRGITAGRQPTGEPPGILRNHVRLRLEKLTASPAPPREKDPNTVAVRLLRPLQEVRASEFSARERSTIRQLDYDLGLHAPGEIFGLRLRNGAREALAILVRKKILEVVGT